MRRVHAGEVRKSCGRIRGCPAKDMAQLRSIGIYGVPRNKVLKAEKGKGESDKRVRKICIISLYVKDWSLFI